MIKTETNITECSKSYFIHNQKPVSVKLFNVDILKSGLPVYEVLRVRDGIPLFLDDHINRLLNTITINKKAIPPATGSIKRSIEALISCNGDKSDGNIKLLVHYPENSEGDPGIYSYFTPHYYPSEEEYSQGVQLIIVNAERENVHSKVLNIKWRSAIRSKIDSENAFEALLADRKGYITEGSKSNFFLIKDDKIVTPPERFVLPGVTRKYILQICRDSGIELTEKSVHKNELQRYDSCFISGTSPGILPVRKIDDTSYKRENRLLDVLIEKYNTITANYISKKGEV